MEDDELGIFENDIELAKFIYENEDIDYVEIEKNHKIRINMMEDLNVGCFIDDKLYGIGNTAMFAYFVGVKKFNELKNGEAII